MGYGRLKKMVQGKDTLSKKQSLPCRRWCRGPLFFLHELQRSVLLLLLHHSGKLAIPHDNLFLLLQIMHLVLFKFLHRQGELSISGDIHFVFWLYRDGNRRLLFLRRSDTPFIRNVFVGIYFWPIFDRQFRKSYTPCAATIRRRLRRYRWQVNTFWDIGLCHWPGRWRAI